MKIHRAMVEEIVSDGERCFVASCLTTGKQCDAYAYADVTPNERERMNRAVDYLEDPLLHYDLTRFCVRLHYL